jgi:hypothetical protein
VHGSATCIDGSNAGGGYDGQLFESIVPDELQEGRFACAGLAGEEYGPAGLVDKPGRQLKIGIVMIG